MSRYHRNAMNVHGVPMSYDLIGCFREAGAVCFDRQIIDQAKYRECWERNVLSFSRYSLLVGSVNENLELYRGILKFYLARNVSTVHPSVLTRLAQLDPGTRVEAYFLYAKELALSYPCAIRGAALKAALDDDRNSFDELFPNSSQEELLRMIRGSAWIGNRL